MTALQDAAINLTNTDRAVLLVATHASEEDVANGAPAYTTVWHGDEFDNLADDTERIGTARTNMALARNQSTWPQVVLP